MVILSRAPFLAVLCGLAAMLALYDKAAPWALLTAAFFITALAAASSFRRELKGYWDVAAATSICVFTSALWIIFSLDAQSNPPLPPFIDSVGIVAESRPWGRTYAVTVKTRDGNFLLNMPDGTLSEGDAVRIEGTPQPLDSGSSGSGFREDRYWKARGVTARLSSFKTRRLDGSAVPFWNIYRWRSVLYYSVIEKMPRLTGAYLNAAWTGKRDAMLDKAHSRWGTSHILAVSGFHVGMVVAGASFVFRRGVWRVPFLSAILWLYVLLTGAPPSAMRAALMIQAGLAGEMVGRPGGAVNSVALAATILLLRSPFWFWDVGWRLSVLAALAIAAANERWSSFGWRTWLFMNAAIWLAVFPQTSWTFGSVPLAGIVINLAAPQFFGAAFSAASLFAALSFLGVPGASFLLSAMESAFVFWELLADAVARAIPWHMAWSPAASYCCAALFILLMCRAFFVPWRSAVILSPLGALAAFAVFVL